MIKKTTSDTEETKTTPAAEEESTTVTKHKKVLKDIAVEPLKNGNGDMVAKPKRDTQKFDDTNSQGNQRIITGFLDLSRDGHGVVRTTLTADEENDAYISTAQIRRFNMRAGDVISGPVRERKDNERFLGMTRVDTINGLPAPEARNIQRPVFKRLTPV
ncbi:hypothetical protein KC721_03700, partial [Candidatus Woesebacteria bacterium]|nr:hypothetical protein [Candidatus Woesebacteria bacterium]